MMSGGVCEDVWVCVSVHVEGTTSEATQLFLDSLHIPRSMWVVLENDLVDSCKAGDDVTIT